MQQQINEINELQAKIHASKVKLQMSNIFKTKVLDGINITNNKG